MARAGPGRRLAAPIALAAWLAGAPAAAATRVDWAQGTLTATAVGIADLRAPSTEIARIGAEREARQRVAAELLAAARALPVAAGGTLGEVAGEKLAPLCAGAKVDLERQSDGSVRARVDLRLDALSALAAGASLTTPDGVAVVDARRLKVRPALGYRIERGGETRWAPMRFVREPPGGKMVRAARARRGVIAVDAEVRGVVVVVLSPEKPGR